MIIDLHCDTIEKAFDEQLKLDSDKLSFNTKLVKQNLPQIQCLATFVHSKYEVQNKGYERASKIIDNFYKTYNPEEMYIIKNVKDLESEQLKTKIGIILTIENGTAIFGKYEDKKFSKKIENDMQKSSNLENIKELYKKGIRMMGIVWNDDNKLASGALTKNDKGLTDLGKQYIRELVKHKIIIDVSHASNKTFWDTCKIASTIVASHSNVKKLCNHPRNLDDEQIKQIAKTGGVIGICFSSLFLTETKVATVKDVVNHIDYIANLVGVEYISFGSDFDGLDKEHILEDIRNTSDYKKIIEELQLRGYTKDDIEKICYKNFIRVAKNIW